MTTLKLSQLEIMPVHPYADEYPLISENEVLELAQDIEAHGLLHPIVIWQDQILDGRNRLRALKKVRGIPDVPVEEFKGTEYEAVEFVRSLNILRRHLDTGQRSILALAHLPYEEAEAERRMKTGKTADPEVDLPQGTEEKERAPQSRDLVADKFSVSGSSISHAKKVALNAPDLAEKVKSGEMKLDKAYRETQARQTEMEKKRSELQNEAPELYSDYVHNNKTLDQSYLELQTRKREAAKAKRASISEAMRIINSVHVRLDEGLKEFNLTVPKLNTAQLDEAMQYVDSMEGMLQITFEALEKAKVMRESGEWED